MSKSFFAAFSQETFLGANSLIFWNVDSQHTDYFNLTYLIIKWFFILMLFNLFITIEIQLVSSKIVIGYGCI